MKKSEIQVGKTYHNGKGRERLILKIGTSPEGFYNSVFYECLNGYKSEWGNRYWMTFGRFASWAKGVVE